MAQSKKKFSQKAGPQPTKCLVDAVLIKLPLLFKQQQAQGVQLILSLKGAFVYNSPPEKTQPVFCPPAPSHHEKGTDLLVPACKERVIASLTLEEGLAGLSYPSESRTDYCREAARYLTRSNLEEPTTNITLIALSSRP